MGHYSMALRRIITDGEEFLTYFFRSYLGRLPLIRRFELLLLLKAFQRQLNEPIDQV